MAVLGLLLLVLTVNHVSSTCVDLPGCTCQLGGAGVREVQCGANVEKEDNGIVATIKPGVILQVQCTFNSSAGDLEMLAGINAGDMPTVQFRYCPLPTSSLGKLLEKMIGGSLNATKTLVFQSYRSLGSELQRHHFSGLFNVTRLELSSNQLEEVPGDLLADMTELTWLDLRDNKARTLPSELLHATPRLAVLELGNNALTELPNHLFSNLPSLRLLNLWSNQLATLNQSIFSSLPGLETLDLHSNGLQSLPYDIFYNLTKLRDLNLSSNNLTSLPEGLFNNSKNLVRLRLLDNQGSTNLQLPSGLLSNLPKLRELSMSRSGITELPPDLLRGAEGLTNLTLLGNRLVTIPGGIFRDLSNLTMLDLSGNKLESLSNESFSGLIKMRVLRLAKNKLQTLSKNVLQKLEQLEELDLSSNGMENVENGAFQSVPRLRVARLANNKLSFDDSPQDDFGRYSPLHQCLGLEELWLSNNSVSEMFADWRHSMLKLRVLNLTNNNFSYVSASDLHFLSDRVTVDLRHNQVSELELGRAETIAAANNLDPQAAEEQHARSVRILASDNPFDCTSCSNYFLLRYRDNLMNPVVNKLFQLDTKGAQCGGDNRLSGTPLANLFAVNYTCTVPKNPQICPTECDCSLRLAQKAYIVQCCKQPLSLPTIKGTNHTELISENCGLKIPPNMYQIEGHERITSLYLSGNNISEFRPRNLPKNVEVLELHNNNLSRLNPWLFDHLKNATGLHRLTLGGNPWHCDCEERGFVSYVQANFKLVADLANVTCEDGRVLSQLSADDLCFGTARIAVAASMAIAAAGLLLGIAAALYYRYQQEVKVWLYARNLCLWFVTEDELDKDKKYDAFISYSHKDEGFVADHLVPGLEPPFKLCIHVRDWVAGDWIPEQIVRSVEHSRRTLVVLSPSFIESVWGRMEFRAAHQQALSEGRARVIVILLEDVGPIDKLEPELRAYLTMNTYLQWGDPWFWDKLRYALPHRADSDAAAAVGWGWGRRRVRDAPSVLARRIEDKLELMYTGVDLGSRGVITDPPSPSDHTPPAAIADQNGICSTNGHTRAV